MQAKGKQGELLKRAVEDLLEHVPENQNFSLLTNSQAFWNTDIKSVRRDLQNLKYSALPFNPESAIAQVKSRKSPYKKNVIIITDAVGLQPNQLKGIDSSFAAHFIVPEAEQRNNIAVDSVFISQIFDDFYEIGVELSTYGENLPDLQIGLYNKEKLAAKTMVKPSAHKTVTFTIPKEDFHGYVSVVDNGLQYDNTLFFSISKPEKTNVLSVGESGKSNFMARIYTSAEFNYNNFEPASLDYNIIEKQDVVVLNELKEIPQALQTTLKSFVADGGSVIVIPSAECPAANLNSLMSNFGNLQFGALRITGNQITKISFRHPLFASVFEKQVENFQYPTTKSAFSIRSTAPAALAYESQEPFLVSLQNQISSVYVFAAPINKENSNFQNSPLIVPTFYNMAQRSSKTGISAFKIGSNSTFVVDATLAKDEIMKVANDDESFIPVQQILSNRVKLTFGDYPQQAGNFGIYNNDQHLKNISFNYSRSESSLADASEIPSEFDTNENIGMLFDALQTNRTENTLWKLFVILALLFLTVELLIQKFVK
jgi:hypothetical protein